MPDSKMRQAVDGSLKGGQKELLESVFEDFYEKRYQVYRMNFIRGIFFGFGSVLGGTVIITLVLWILSLFIGLPWFGDFVEWIKGALNR